MNERAAYELILAELEELEENEELKAIRAEVTEAVIREAGDEEMAVLSEREISVLQKIGWYDLDQSRIVAEKAFAAWGVAEIEKRGKVLEPEVKEAFVNDPCDREDFIRRVLIPMTSAVVETA